MESQLKLYDNQVDYSTVSLSLREVTTFTPIAPESAGIRIGKGFVKNMKLFKTGLVNFIIGIMITSPLWLPAAGAVFVMIRFRRRKKKKTSAVSAPSEEKPSVPSKD
jgi:hypothetical protein